MDINNYSKLWWNTSHRYSKEMEDKFLLCTLGYGCHENRSLARATFPLPLRFISIFYYIQILFLVITDNQ